MAKATKTTRHKKIRTVDGCSEGGRFEGLGRHVKSWQRAQEKSGVFREYSGVSLLRIERVEKIVVAEA